MDTRQLTHEQLPITAPAYMWHAMGFVTYANVDTVNGSLRSHFGSNKATQLLSMAVAKGLNGEQALLYYAEESQRQHEHELSTTAIKNHAESISKLASALSQSANREVVNSILLNLSEVTSKEVKRQLEGTSLLSN